MAIRLIARVGARELRHVLVAGEALIGSDPGCDFVLGDPTVSRRHARVALTSADTVDVHDLDSRNGIEIDGRRVRSEPGLQPGARFRIGEVEVRIEAADVNDAQPVTAGLAAAPSPPVPGTPVATIALAPRLGFAAQALPSLLHAAAAGQGISELANACVQALVEHGLAGAAVHGERGAVLAQAGRTAHEASYRLARAGIVVLLWHEGDQAEASLAGLATMVLDLLALARARVEVTPAASARSERIDGAQSATAPAPPASADPVVRELYRQAEVVAGSRLNVLIEGESGTGKELFARYLHDAAGLAPACFVALNCAALSRDLLDAELFGIEAGVATGVSARAGRFEQAHGGTLFLDEVADMSADTQARLLRVLQEGVVYRIGSDRPRPAQARVVSACNRPLKAMVELGHFRLDLYHRIADWTARLPALRDRPGDITLLAGQFLERECRARGIGYAGISQTALNSLLGYEWPGNVRELQREMLRVALFLNDGEVVDSALLKPEIRAMHGPGVGADGGLEQQLAVHERRILRAALNACDGNVLRAAERLGIGKSTLYRRLTALAIDPGSEAITP